MASALKLANAGTSAVTVTPWRAIAAKADSGLGLVRNTVVAPTAMAPSRPGQASGKLWADGSAARYTSSEVSVHSSALAVAL